MDPFKVWEEAREAYKAGLVANMERMLGRPGGILPEGYLEGIEKQMQKWLHEHPVPTAGEAAHTGEKILSTEEKLRHLEQERRLLEASEKAAGERAFQAFRRARNARRGVEGAVNLSTVVGVAGTAGVGTVAIAGAKALFKLWVEDQLLTGAINGMEQTVSAVNQANCPNTVKQAQGMYDAYVRSCHHEYVNRAGEMVVEQQAVLAKEQWLMTNYGVRWDVLTK